MPKFCDKCGAELRGNGRFCDKCGAKVNTPDNTAADGITYFCPHCGKKIPYPTTCPYCGKSVKSNTDDVIMGIGIVGVIIIAVLVISALCGFLLLLFS